MKVSLSFLTAFLMLSVCFLHGQTYVNVNATGANTGTSWTDAYSTMDLALGNANPNDEIWVAAGTYIPGDTANKLNHFLIDKNLKLYGGFDGTETLLADRDPVTNLTILSGDVNGDDGFLNGSFLNRSDNVYQIMVVTSNVDNSALVDGFTFQGGHANGPFAPGIDAKRGGAINTQGSIQVNGCTFIQNYCEDLGGAFFAYGNNASQLRISGCRFENNRSDNVGGGIFLFDLPSSQIDSCEFYKNSADFRGGGLYLHNSGSTLEDNLFSENTALRTGGGMVIAAVDVSGLTVQCTHNEFVKNYSNSGGAAGIFVNSNDNNISLVSCEFTENETRHLLPGVWSAAGAVAIIHQPNSNAMRNKILVEDCLIQDNHSVSNIGGLNYINAGAGDNEFVMRDCRVFNNAADDSVGGVAILTLNETCSATIDRTHFKNNYSPDGLGLVINRWNTLPYSPNLKFVVSNCLFTEHTDLARTNFAVGIHNVQVDVINSTIADNQTSALGVRRKGEFRLVNTLLDNPGHKELSDTLVTNPADVVVTSGGGNLVSDTTLDAWLGLQDLSNTDPLFEVGTYRLSISSPAVDLGIFFAGFDPSHMDLVGNPRWQGSKIDAGAYESPYTTAIKDLIVRNTSLTMYPNPVTYHTTLDLENEWRGNLSLTIFNDLGQQVYLESLHKAMDQIEHKVDLGRLSQGNYRLVLSNGKEAIVKAFVKI